MYIYNADLEILDSQFADVVRKYLPDTVISVITPVEMNEITLMQFINNELGDYLENKESEGFSFLARTYQRKFNIRIEHETNEEILKISNFRLVDTASKWAVEAKAIDAFVWMAITHSDGWETLAEDDLRVYAEIQTANIIFPDCSDFDDAMTVYCVLALDPETKKVTVDFAQGDDLAVLFELQDAQDYFSNLLSTLFEVKNFRERNLDIYPQACQIGTFTLENIIPHVVGSEFIK